MLPLFLFQQVRSAVYESTRKQRPSGVETKVLTPFI